MSSLVTYVEVWFSIVICSIILSDCVTSEQLEYQVWINFMLLLCPFGPWMNLSIYLSIMPSSHLFLMPSIHPAILFSCHSSLSPSIQSSLSHAIHPSISFSIHPYFSFSIKVRAFSLLERFQPRPATNYGRVHKLLVITCSMAANASTS